MENEKFLNNYEFSNKWEYECTFMAKEYPGYAITIWSRYINDIMNHKAENTDTSFGLSRDWAQKIGPYKSNSFDIIDANEYIEDLKQYVFSPDFSFDETDDALGLIISFLEFARENDYTVIARLK